MKLLTTLLMLVSSTAFSAALDLDFAFRDASSPNEGLRRNVVLQGARIAGSARLDSRCATAGACECVLFRTQSDPTPLTGIGGEVSRGNNTFMCRVPGESAAAANFVKLRLRGGADLTAMIPIRTTLTIDDVLGASLKKEQVRGIFRYACSRTFFEGEGVTAGEISCVAGQHLGVINASYNFYTYKSSVDSNSPAGDSVFPADICRRFNFLKTQCTGNAPELRYGFYRTSVDPFVVGISMTRAPEAAPGDDQPLTDTYGYAALPDEAGDCAPGLEKARPYIAQPASILPRGPACPKDGCPSSFINTGNLNNVVVETAKPVSFSVTRAPNTAACDATGDCTNATFGSVQKTQSVSYVSQTPVLCVIPSALLNGLF